MSNVMIKGCAYHEAACAQITMNKPVTLDKLCLNVGIERKQFNEWSRDGRRLNAMELLYAEEAWKAATLIERERCAQSCGKCGKDLLRFSD